VNEQVSELPDDSAEQPAKVARIGLLLRKAREARGLTVADVVTALKYSPRQIEALEADEMELLPGNVFMRGIVRSYARFLKLDPVPLLALLESEAPVTMPDVVPPEDMGVAMPRTEGRQISGLMSALILVAIVGAAAGVWHLLAPVQRPVPATAEQAVVEVPSLAPVPATTMGQPTASAVGAEPIQSSEVLAPATKPAPVDLAVAPPQLTPAPSPAVEPATGSTPEAARPIPAGAKQLIFEFRGTSWVEVKDASERIIFTGQYFGGTRQTAMGKPPFQIVVGNAPTVELKYEGRSVDLKPYIRADVARLTLE
jgi:cytoskeleton protein RodZ